MLHRADTGRRPVPHIYLMVALLCAFVLVMTAAAQRKPQRAKGPRAVALVQWIGSGPPRVIPIAILVDGRFYDASIYKASPVPMALEPGTVYEVEESGESVGMATLTEVKQTAQGAWFADARYQTREQLAAARVPRRAEKPVMSEPETGPPKLRRAPAKDTSSAPAPAPTPPATTSEPRGSEEPPVLRKPKPETPTSQPSGEGESAKSSQPTQPAPAPEDTDRPVLRRGHRSAEQAEPLPGAVSTPAPGAKKAATTSGATSATTKPVAPAPRRVLAAISDAGGPEPRSFRFGWTPAEKIRLTNAVEALASAALAEYARTHPGATPGKLEDLQVRAFDVDYNNAPDLVLTARASEAAPAPTRRPAVGRAGATTQAPPVAVPGGVTFWITLVARQDFNGDLHKLKVLVTDSKHLDAFPRLELIDAIDVDGDGRGELIFREISDVDRNYVIYRVTPDNLKELFNTAEQ